MACSNPYLIGLGEARARELSVEERPLVFQSHHERIAEPFEWIAAAGLTTPAALRSFSSRAGICCTAQLLPSGSLKKMNPA
jgi:hypothetical protein